MEKADIRLLSKVKQDLSGFRLVSFATVFAALKVEIILRWRKRTSILLSKVIQELSGFRLVFVCDSFSRGFSLH